jgi:alanine racemase
MNLTMVEVTGLPEVKEGDRAVLLGRDRDQYLSAEELAGWAQTISYEIYCGLGTANLRRYTGV